MIDKVFHYTSISTLKKILENKTIRFSRFDQMDDKTETEGLPEDMKLNFFLSCWSSEQRESIPQWCLYGNGIRIELPQKWYKRTKEDFSMLPIDHPGRESFRPFDKSYTFHDIRHFATPANENDA